MEDMEDQDLHDSFDVSETTCLWLSACIAWTCARSCNYFSLYGHEMIWPFLNSESSSLPYWFKT